MDRGEITRGKCRKSIAALPLTSAWLGQDRDPWGGDWVLEDGAPGSECRTLQLRKCELSWGSFQVYG